MKKKIAVFVPAFLNFMQIQISDWVQIKLKFVLNVIITLTSASLADLKLSLFEYINGFYNSVRPHSHNNGLTPNQAEIDFV